MKEQNFRKFLWNPISAILDLHIDFVFQFLDLDVDFMKQEPGLCFGRTDTVNTCLGLAFFVQRQMHRWPAPPRNGVETGGRKRVLNYSARRASGASADARKRPVPDMY